MRTEQLIREIEDGFERFPSDGKIKIIFSALDEERAKAQYGLPEFWNYRIADNMEQAEDIFRYFNKKGYDTYGVRGVGFGLNIYSYSWGYKTNEQKRFESNFKLVAIFVFLILVIIYFVVRG